MFLFVILKEMLAVFLHFSGEQRVLVTVTLFLFSLYISLWHRASPGILVTPTLALHSTELGKEKR